MQKVLFKKLPTGATFTYMGKSYQKTSPSYATDSSGSKRLFSDYSTVFWHDNVSLEQAITAEQSLGQST